MRSFATILLALSLPLHAFASHGISHRRHADLALRPRQGNNARMTFYDITTGLTACGHSHGANDFVVALNAAQFGNTPGNSPFCGKSITITYNGKSTSAIIDDKCPGCPPGGLDLTQGLFEFFASVGTGVIYGDWTVGGGEAHKAPATSSTPPPSPTSHYTPPTTTKESTSSPPPPSSSSTSTSTTSKTSSSVSSAAPTTSHQPSSTPSPASSGANYNNPPASSLAQPSGTISPGQNESINSVYGAIIGMGSLVVALNP